MRAQFWKNKKVFVTGHTGFKGGWLSLWLKSWGAKVTGYSLQPPTKPSFFELTQLSELVDSKIEDVRDYETLKSTLLKSEPEIVFHMAAQPLVRYSYQYPVETYATNVMGTVHLLDAIRTCPSVQSVVSVTSDKVYENQEWEYAYRENDRLNGHDPYSNSKSCADLVTDAFRKSFFKNTKTSIATARSGNVIGGGDWASDRLVPDAIRALNNKIQLVVRNPDAVRPWQHVLDPVAGYMLLAEQLYKNGNKFSGNWNFGPDQESCRTVGWILQQIQNHASLDFRAEKSTDLFHEAKLLKLDCVKAKSELNWKPVWNIEAAIVKTLDWYAQKEKHREYSLKQIADYCENISNTH